MYGVLEDKLEGKSVLHIRTSIEEIQLKTDQFGD